MITCYNYGCQRSITRFLCKIFANGGYTFALYNYTAIPACLPDTLSLFSTVTINIESVVRGYHVYMDVYMGSYNARERLQLVCEPSIVHDRTAVEIASKYGTFKEFFLCNEGTWLAI